MNSEKTKLIIVGSKGRMGEALLRLGKLNPKLEIVAGVDKDDSLLESIDLCDVLIEFAHHSLTPTLVKAAADHGKSVVIGTTGHTAGERKAITDAAHRIPVVFASNYSVGVNLLFFLTQIAAESLDDDYDREVVEMHHRLKLDAPSGTARTLAEILAEAAGGTYEDLTIHGRHGDVGQRPKRIIGMHALRGGDVVGDHTVYFSTVGERLELTHRATSRDTFASGALRAAQWVRAQKPGLFSMRDVLGLKR